MRFCNTDVFLSGYITPDTQFVTEKNEDIELNTLIIYRYL